MKKARTYDAWQAKGRQVRQGEKAVDRDDYGRPLFTKSQTDKASTRPSDPHWEGDIQEEKCDAWVFDIY